MKKKHRNNCNIITLLLLPFIYPFWFCMKKEKLRKSGYTVDKPDDFDYDNWGSIQTHGMWDVPIYYKYGKTYSYQELRKIMRENELNKNYY